MGCAGVAVALCLCACASAPPGLTTAPPPDRAAVLFLATVDRIEYSPLTDSDLNWTIYMNVDRVISGPSPGETFSFRVRNPTREGIEVGRKFRIRAVPFGAGYRLDRYERVKTAPRGAVKSRNDSGTPK
ncbi:MAG: hypothetical protein WCP22_11765 [Chlamydiota bacterium]